MENINKKLTLVGAGPGDPELITLKGARALEKADVVLYDALVDKRLLSYTQPGALRINVGKRRNNHSYSQTEINKMIVYFAKKGRHVVRLKGGDPFVFGRGTEESDYAQAHGIQVETVPGITSAIAVPGAVGIPMTRRGVNHGFAVITATGSNGRLSEDLLQLVKTNIPVVVLMGIHKIEEITALYTSHGKHGLPIAVISKGTTKEEQVVAATVETLLQTVNKDNIESPGIIVIGETVKSGLHYRQWLTDRQQNLEYHEN